MLQHGDGRAVGVPVRKALLELGGVILAQQINPLTQKTPIEGAEHCLSNYRGSLQNGRQFNFGRLRDLSSSPGPAAQTLRFHRLHPIRGVVLQEHGAAYPRDPQRHQRRNHERKR